MRHDAGHRSGEPGPIRSVHTLGCRSEPMPLAPGCAAAPRADDSCRRSRRAVLATAETGSGEAPYQLAGRDRQRPRRDDVRAPLLRDVVVVAIEASPRNSCALGKGVQLHERDIADEVAPQPTAARPRGRIDKDRHRLIVAYGRQWMFARPTRGG